MFGLFSPNCPVEPSFKVWAETRFAEIVKEIGVSSVRDVDVLIPGHPELPKEFRGTDDCIRKIFELACFRMGIGAATIEFSVADDEFLASELGRSAHGLYYHPQEEGDKPRVLVAGSLVRDPERLLAVIAHELAHEFLRLRLPHIYAEPDMEEITDMVPVMFGMGVYLANATLREAAETSNLAFSWSWSQSGYLNSESYGYIIALFAWIRGELSPDWTTHLRLDARETFKKAIKYLRKTNDCLVDRDFRLPLLGDVDSDDLSRWLQGNSHTLQVHALAQLALRPSDAATLQSEISWLLRSSKPDVVKEAVRTLSVCEAWTAEAHEELLFLRHHDKPAVRYELVSAIRPGSPNDELTVLTLVCLMEDIDLHVARAAAAILSQFESIPETVRDSALHLIRRILPAGLDCDSVFPLLRTIDPDFELLIEDWFGDDPEWMNILKDQLAEFHELLEADETNE